MYIDACWPGCFQADGVAHMCVMCVCVCVCVSQGVYIANQMLARPDSTEQDYYDLSDNTGTPLVSRVCVSVRVRVCGTMPSHFGIVVVLIRPAGLPSLCVRVCVCVCVLCRLRHASRSTEVADGAPSPHLQHSHIHNATGRHTHTHTHTSASLTLIHNAD